MRELVDVLTPGGTVTVDVTATAEMGNLDTAELETTGMVLEAVRRGIGRSIGFDTPKGERVLLMPAAVLALTYRRDPA